MPAISVVAPTYNHERYVAEAIESVLCQSFQDFELIVSDDASTDGTLARLKQFRDPRLKIIENSINRGIFANTALAYGYARGEYVAWLGTDDVYEPHMLDTLLKFLQSHPDTIGVFGESAYIDDDSNALGTGSPPDGVGKGRFELLREMFFVRNHLCNPAGLVRRSILDRFGYFPPQFKQLSDMNLWVRILFESEIVVVPDILIKYRMQANSKNAGALTEESHARFRFETIQCLQEYSKRIKDIKTLKSIFPEVEGHPWPLVDELSLFHLAHVAIMVSRPEHQLFGLQLLHELFSDPNTAKRIETLCGLSYSYLFKTVGEQQIFYDAASVWSERNKYGQQIEQLGHEHESLGQAYNSLAHAYESLRKEHYDLSNKLNEAERELTRLRPLEAEALASKTPSEFRGARFGDSFALGAVEISVAKERTIVKLVWQALKRMQLKFTVCFHVIDSNGALINRDYRQDVDERWVEDGEIWVDKIDLQPTEIIDAQKLGIGIFEVTEPLTFLHVDRGTRDYGNARLLIDLASSDSTPVGALGLAD